MYDLMDKEPGPSLKTTAKYEVKYCRIVDAVRRLLS